MEELFWESNTKEIFEKIIEATPRVYKNDTRENLLSACIKNAGMGKIVTQKNLIDSIKEVIPKHFLHIVLKTVEQELIK